MQISLDLPEDVVRQLQAAGQDISRAVLEGLALEGYRSGNLTESQVRRILGFDTRYEVHGFLKQHDVPLQYNEQDLDRDVETALKFTEKWPS
ncbi:MAG TPA: UPF0175 family protein [Bryobacteraceae bacterium]|jgi:hypothetical protein|nr:UPF0175 family protein [Bryobacteraceae bacterium]